MEIDAVIRTNMLKLGLSTPKRERVPVSMPTPQIKQDIIDNTRPDHADSSKSPDTGKNLFDYKKEEWETSGSKETDKKNLIQSIFSLIEDTTLPLFYKIGKGILSFA